MDVDVYNAKNFVPEISLIKYDNLTSIIWLEVLKGIMRLIVLLFFVNIINKFYEKYAFNANLLIKFLGVIFLLFNVILIFMLTNVYVLYLYLFPSELRANLDVNIFNFWLINFLNLLNLKDVLFMVITNNLFPILILYTIFLKFLNHKNYISITTGVIDKWGKRTIKRASLKEQVTQNKVKQCEKVDEHEINHNDLEKQGSQASVIVLNKLGIDHFVNLEDIIVIEADGNYLNILTDEDSYLARSSSKEMLSSLPSYFLRIHRSTIINLNKVKGTKNDYSSKNMKAKVLLVNNTSYVISQSYKKTFNEQWQKTNCSL
ncbi:LytR/AlgR family response regulator transcription factor [Paraphotobacterium marinum]|nr:LytTR family DNA-binding domain-containing protein [Paraphotobacterium marinum]